MKTEMRSVTPASKWTGAASDELACGHKLAEEAFGKDACDNPNSGLLALPYLWRRFGPPWCGSDDHKELACYYLSTDDPEVLLWVSPRGSGLSYGIGHMVSPKVRAAACAPRAKALKREKSLFERWWVRQRPEKDWKNFEKWTEEEKKEAQEAFGADYYAYPNSKAWLRFVRETGYKRNLPPQGGAASKRVQKALQGALRELLRPVFVRDVPINILGVVRGETRLKEAKVSVYAGHGIPKEAMDKLAGVPVVPLRSAPNDVWRWDFIYNTACSGLGHD
jgi:hypothetical protein